MYVLGFIKVMRSYHVTLEHKQTSCKKVTYLCYVFRVELGRGPESVHPVLPLPRIGCCKLRVEEYYRYI